MAGIQPHLPSGSLAWQNSIIIMILSDVLPKTLSLEKISYHRFVDFVKLACSENPIMNYGELYFLLPIPHILMWSSPN